MSRFTPQAIAISKLEAYDYSTEQYEDIVVPLLKSIARREDIEAALELRELSHGLFVEMCHEALADDEDVTQL